MKKFNFQTREIVNVPVMIPDGLQAFLGAVCMLEKKWFVAVFQREFGGVRPALYQTADIADSSTFCDEATFDDKHCCLNT